MTTLCCLIQKESCLEPILPAAISAVNRHVAKVLESGKHTKLRGKYNKYSPELRAEIGRVAGQVGTKSTAVRFTKQLGKRVNESTVRSIRKAYREALSRKRKSGEAGDRVLSIRPKKRGKPLLLGDKIDASVQQYILSVAHL